MPKLSQVLQNREKHWIEAAFDDYDKTQQREPYIRTHFSPSQAHLCPRALYYHMLGYDQDPIASQSLRRMGIGTVFHEFIEKKLTETGLLVSSEEEINICPICDTSKTLTDFLVCKCSLIIPSE